MVLSIIWSRENFSATVWRARAARRRASARSVSNSRMAAATGSGSLSASQPFSPCRTISGNPPVRLDDNRNAGCHGQQDSRSQAFGAREVEKQPGAGQVRFQIARKMESYSGAAGRFARKVRAFQRIVTGGGQQAFAARHEFAQRHTIVDHEIFSPGTPPSIMTLLNELRHRRIAAGVAILPARADGKGDAARNHQRPSAHIAASVWGGHRGRAPGLPDARAARLATGPTDERPKPDLAGLAKQAECRARRAACIHSAPSRRRPSIRRSACHWPPRISRPESRCRMRQS